MAFNYKFHGNSRRKGLSSIVAEFLGWLEVILIAFIIYILIHSFVFETTVVSMSSMENTLVGGQRLIVWKPVKYFSRLRKGDIVSFVYQEGKRKGIAKIINPLPDPHEVAYIKRIIGLPGDKIDIKEGKVFLNGKELDESYVKGETTDNRGMKFPQIVPEGKLFVMGDNRSISRDSREFGFIEINSIRGKAVLTIWPINRLGLVK